LRNANMTREEIEEGLIDFLGNTSEEETQRI